MSEEVQDVQQEVVDNQEVVVEESASIEDSGLSQEVKDEVQDIVENSATEEEAKAKLEALKKKMVKGKAYGKEFEKEYDLTDEEVIKRLAEKDRGFDVLAQEQALVKKQLAELFTQLKENPLGVLGQIEGLNLKEHIDKYVQGEVDEASLTEEQKKQRELENKLKEYEEKEKKAEEQKKLDTIEKEKKNYIEKLNKDIAEALDSKESLLATDNPMNIRMIAGSLKSLAAVGKHEYPIKDIVSQMESQFIKDVQSVAARLAKNNPEKLIQLIGAENLDALRKTKISQKKAQTANNIKDTGKPKETKEEEVSFKKLFSRHP